MISRLFERVVALPHPAVDRALAAALPTAGADEVRQLAQELIRRGSAAGRQAVVEMFHRLPEDIRAQVLANPDPYLHAIRRAGAATRSASAGNAVAIVRHARLGSMAYLVAGVLRHGDPPRRRAAAQALLELTLWCTASQSPAGSAERSDGGRACTPEDAAYIESAVAEAVAHYSQHREDDALRAYLCLQPRRLAQLTRVLADDTHLAVVALRRMLTPANEAVTRRALLAMIPVTTLTDAATAGIRQSLRRGGFGDVLGGHHMLRRPEVRRIVEAWETPTDWLPQAQDVGAMDANAQIGLVHWLDALSLPGPDRCEALASWLDALTSPVARALVARRLLDKRVATGNEAGTAAVVEWLVHDRDESVAKLAAGRCLRMHARPEAGAITRTMIGLLRSPHASVVRLAETKLAERGFEQLWVTWPKLSEERRLASAEAFMKIDSRFHESLRRRLGDGAGASVIQALQMVAVLDQGPFFEREVVALVDHPDAKVVASAVRALGSVGGSAAAVIGRMLGHRDARVRANAVEAWQQLDAQDQDQHAALLHAMVEREANRPRANAIRALLGRMRQAPASPASPDPDAALDQMLHDPRPEHRLSALWVAESAEVDGLAAAVGEMAVSDPDEAVRHRAERVFEQMIHSLSAHGTHATTRTNAPGALARIESSRTQTDAQQQGAA